jgi:uncharacterized membrane protein YcjF (UPF0283 family)
MQKETQAAYALSARDKNRSATAQTLDEKAVNVLDRELNLSHARCAQLRYQLDTARHKIAMLRLAFATTAILWIATVMAWTGFLLVGGAQ